MKGVVFICVALTGDRPSGALHLGHYKGSLESRLKLQNEFEQYILIADVQALTDNAHNPEKIKHNVLELLLDYLAVGIDPAKSTICIQSKIPAIAELTIFYLNLVTVGRLERNPTVRQELKLRNFDGGVPAGFLMYPVSQVADITAFNAKYVPVGADQSPMLEQTREVVRKFNSIYGNVLVEPEIILSKTSRLIGTDGKNKMSKSLNNAILLSDEPDIINKKIMGMYTDPNHININDPGNVDDNPVFMYLEAFGTDSETITKLRENYKRGGLGDVKVKKYLNEVLQEFLAPIRDKRKELAKDIKYVYKIAAEGTEKAKNVTSETLKSVKKAMKIDYEEIININYFC